MSVRSGLAAVLIGGALVLGLRRETLRRKLAQLLSPDEAPGPDDVVAFAPHPSGNGGWTLDRRGNIYAFGNAPEFREIPEPEPWREAPFVAMACTPSGRGLWTLDRRGNIYAFGDAPEFREVPQPEPWREASFVSIAATPSGRGVWIADSRGSVLAFGDATDLRRPA